MTFELSHFAARLRKLIKEGDRSTVAPIMKAADRLHSSTAIRLTPVAGGDRPRSEDEFNGLALELFALQFKHNAPYRCFCEARGAAHANVAHWTQIPAVPAAAFKELELSCLPVAERTTVFHSSGTTGQQPSRHSHSAESLALYEASLLPWFYLHVVPDYQLPIANLQLAILTPPPVQAAHSSLVHMFETVRRKSGAPESAFVGRAAGADSHRRGEGPREPQHSKLAGSSAASPQLTTVHYQHIWTLDFDATLRALRKVCSDGSPLVLLGTAFSFVHLLDELNAQALVFELPVGSRVMETGGYKSRSRSLPKADLHSLITQRLGIPPTHIVCEYGMSELSSQAYDREARRAAGGGRNEGRVFRFPPWVRVQIISPETGREVDEGETGLIRLFDLANVFSVMAIQTEDLGVRRGAGFELIGRAALAEPRGCSLMAV